jgi:hypothetical protein
MTPERRDELIETLQELRKQYRSILVQITELEHAIAEDFTPSKEQQQWIDVYRQGYTVDEVRTGFGVSGTHVQNALLAAGVIRHTRQPAGNRAKRPWIEQAIRDARNGKRMEETGYGMRVGRENFTARPGREVIRHPDEW